jgi:iron complex transport system ATP-binding protein
MGRYAHHRWWQWREEPQDHQSIERALRAVRMETFAHRGFDTLSSGERQRVWLALALAQEARALLLDEPTSHLDVGVAREILRLLRAQADAGKAVVCVLHDVNEAAEFADRILLIGVKRVLAFDVPERVLTPAFLEEAYGIRMESIRTADGGIRVFPAPASH